MKAHRTIRYRLHAGTRAKYHQLSGTAGACRYAWNHFVGKLKDDYIAYGKCDPEFYSLGKHFVLIRKHYAPWLQEYSCAIVRGSLQPIETAYKKFYKGNGGLPQFHAQYKRDDSFPLVTGTFKLEGQSLHIQKIGQFHMTGNNPYPNAIAKSGTVKQECGNWYAYIVYEVEIEESDRMMCEVGIGRNVKQITCSNGTVYELPNTSTLEARKRRYQRKMARRQCGNRKHKTKPSNRYLRAKHQHAVTSKKIVQVRTNWCHQVSRELSNKYSLVHLEELNIKGITASAKGTLNNPGKNVKAKTSLNRSILNSCWGKLQQCLDYKTNTNYVNSAYTSRICYVCGHVDKDNRKTQANFLCKACGHRDNADVNAALNILAFGNGAAGRGGGEVTRPMKRQIGTSICLVD